MEKQKEVLYILARVAYFANEGRRLMLPYFKENADEEEQELIRAAIITRVIIEIKNLLIQLEHVI